MEPCPFFYGMAAWFPVLERYFGWNRAQLALAFSFTRAEGSISGPLGGYLIDRVGSRRMVLIGLLIAGGGFLFYGRVQKPLAVSTWRFLIVSTGTGVGLLPRHDDGLKQLVRPETGDCYVPGHRGNRCGRDTDSAGPGLVH